MLVFPYKIERMTNKEGSETKGINQSEFKVVAPIPISRIWTITFQVTLVYTLYCSWCKHCIQGRHPNYLIKYLCNLSNAIMFWSNIPNYFMFTLLIKYSELTK